MNNNNKIIKIIQTQEIQHIDHIYIKQCRITYFGILITVNSVPQKYFMDSISVLENYSDNLKIWCNIVNIIFVIIGA